VKPDEHVLDTIARSFQLSMLMVSCFTFEQATHVLELAGAVLHSRTKAIAHSAGVVIDGPMLIDGVQSALFFYAFKDYVDGVASVDSTCGRPAGCVTGPFGFGSGLPGRVSTPSSPAG